MIKLTIMMALFVIFLIGVLVYMGISFKSLLILYLIALVLASLIFFLVHKGKRKNRQGEN